MKNVILINFIQVFILSSCMTFEDIKPTFEKMGCIEGSLVSLGSGKILMKRTESSKTILKTSRLKQDVENDLDDSTAALKENIEKNPLMLVQELAEHNKIEYYYYLIDEEGPSHDKVFKMELTLGKENYIGEGRSMKKAKTYVAQLALITTKYVIPPIKTKVKPEAQTPTVQLNNLASKYGLKVTYVLHNEFDNEEVIDENSKILHIPEMRAGKSYTTRLNDSIYHPFKTRYTKLANENTNGQPFHVVVHVGDKVYTGSGYTIQSARHDAAANAIKALYKMSQTEVEDCLAKGETCNANNIKSPISLVYETAQKRNLPVQFEIIKEAGPAHEKEFVTKCQVGDLVTEGEGKSKKTSKKVAAEKMLKKLEKIEPIVDAIVIGNMKANLNNKKRKKKKKNKKVVKSSVDKFAKDAGGLWASAYEYFVPSDSKLDESLHSTESSGKREPRHDLKNDGTYNPKETLLDLTQQTGIPINFLDLFEVAHKHYSLLSLGIDPQHICLGEGTTFTSAHEKASLEALKFLYGIGLTNIVPKKEGFEYISGIDFDTFEVSQDLIIKKESK